MVDENKKGEKAEKLAELMNDANYELNLDALEDAAGGSGDGPVDTFYEEYPWLPR